MNQLPENSLRIYDVTLVTSYLIGLGINLTKFVLLTMMICKYANKITVKIK